jgi:hypothetical protein
MNIHYKIVEVWPDTHSMIVRYYTDLVTEASLASDDNIKDDGSPVRCKTDVSIGVPIPEPTEEDIKNLAMRNIPYKFLKFKEDVITGNVDFSMANAIALLNIDNFVDEDFFTSNTSSNLP